MAEYLLSNRARGDLLDILVYGMERFGAHQADRYAAGLDHVFQLLADNPDLGRKAEVIGPGVRRHEYEAHVILYEHMQGGVRILAVVHGRSVRRLAL